MNGRHERQEVAGLASRLDTLSPASDHLSEAERVTNFMINRPAPGPACRLSGPFMQALG